MQQYYNMHIIVYYNYNISNINNAYMAVYRYVFVLGIDILGIFLLVFHIRSDLSRVIKQGILLMCLTSRRQLVNHMEDSMDISRMTLE